MIHDRTRGILYDLIQLHDEKIPLRRFEQGFLAVHSDVYESRTAQI